MEKFDVDLFNSVKKINQSDFKSLGTNFGSHEEFYRSKLIGEIKPKKLDVYHKISKFFELFDAFSHYDILKIDTILSGIYEITSDHIISMMDMVQSEYCNTLNKFVKTLSQQELKQMLVTFGNTLSLDNKYNIYVSDTIKTDIHIAACCRTVTINKILFEDTSNLDNLRLYFLDSDDISDGKNIMRNYGQDSEFDNNPMIHIQSGSSGLDMPMGQIGYIATDSRRMRGTTSIPSARYNWPYFDIETISSERIFPTNHSDTTVEISQIVRIDTSIIDSSIINTSNIDSSIINTSILDAPRIFLSRTNFSQNKKEKRYQKKILQNQQKKLNSTKRMKQKIF